MRGIAATLATVWRIASPYFSSEERWFARLLLGAIIAIELGIVAITVLINQWNASFYNALQDRNWDSFVYELGYFCVLAAIFIVAAVYQLYLNQWLQIRWRRWMTRAYLERWLEGSNHYRMQLLGDAADNPDQRIQEDLNLFTTYTVSLSMGLLNAAVTFVSFVGILWSLSSVVDIGLPALFGGGQLQISGFMVWMAVLYYLVGSAITFWIGKPQVRLNNRQQQLEANFRHHLIRVREHAEAIALDGGERVEGAQIGLRAAAARPARGMRRVPGFHRRRVVEAEPVGMADHGRPLRRARPVLAGAVLAGGKRGAVGLRAGEDIVAVRRVAAAVDDLALLAHRRLLGQAVLAVQLVDVPGDDHALGVEPWPLADAVAGVDRGLAVGGLGREIGTPGLAARACRLGERLAVVVGAGKAAEVTTVADRRAGDEEAHGRGLRMDGRGGKEQKRGGEERTHGHGLSFPGSCSGWSRILGSAPLPYQHTRPRLFPHEGFDAIRTNKTPSAQTKRRRAGSATPRGVLREF